MRGADGGDRPCRACRACRMVEHGNHPDLHVLEPEGPGGQVGIGGKDGKRGVRDLVTELSLLPVEGVARVAIIGDAQRMNDDAQSALLKTLEEPPVGHDPDPRRRRRGAAAADGPLAMRPGPARARVGARDIETLLAERDLADAPTAARLARLAGGRAGLAVAYAAAPEAEAIRNELEPDAARPPRAPAAPTRLLAAKGLLARAGCARRAARPGAGGAGAPRRRRGAGATREAARQTADPRRRPSTPIRPSRRGRAGRQGVRRGTASRARRCCSTRGATSPATSRSPRLGATGDVRDVALLEELEAAARALPDGAAAAALARLVCARRSCSTPTSAPELVLDVAPRPLAATIRAAA